MGRIHRRPLWILAQQRKGRIQLTHEHLAAPLPLSVFALSAAFGLKPPEPAAADPTCQSVKLNHYLKHSAIRACSRPAPDRLSSVLGTPNCAKMAQFGSRFEIGTASSKERV